MDVGINFDDADFGIDAYSYLFSILCVQEAF